MKFLEKTFQVETKENLTVVYHSENIGITIAGNKEKVQSELKLKFQFKGDEENVEDLLKINFDEEKNTLNIDFADIEDEFEIKKAEVRLDVPFKTKIMAKTENGSLIINNLEGKQILETENGAIKLFNILGNIQVETENGAIILENITGDELIKSENGAIKLKRNTGKIKIRSENGAIKLSECGEELDVEFENGTARILESYFKKATVKNENGGIYYEFTPIEKGDFRFENENGKIQLVIPEEIPYDIKAKNIHGSFHVGLKGNYDRFRENGHYCLHVVKGSGNVKIYAENENGSIRLVENLQSQHTFNFDLDDFSEKMDHLLDKIPNEKQRMKVKVKIEKAKNKMKNLKFNIPEIDINLVDALNGVDEEIKKHIKNTDFIKIGTDKTDKIQKKVKIIMDKFQDKFENQTMNEKEILEVNERSRLKILELLEQGKITSEEAERLISAMEGRNERD